MPRGAPRRARTIINEVQDAGDSLVRLRPVDRAEVTIVMDNFVDLLLAPAEDIRRYVPYDLGDRQQLVAEHGFSALITVEREGQRSTALYDAGLTPDGLARNLDVLEVRVRDLRAIVISHGHADHHGGLEGLFARYGRLRLPLVIPSRRLERKVVLPTGAEAHRPSCTCVLEPFASRRRFGRLSRLP